MNRISVGACLFLIVLSSACARFPASRTAALLDDVVSYVNERPDSALSVLESLDSADLNTRRLRASHALLTTMARDKCYLDITAPDLLKPAERYFERHGSPDERMKTLYYRGRIAQESNDCSGAAVFFSRAENYAGSVTDKHSLGLLYLAEAALYNQVHNLKKEREYIELGLAVFNEIDDPQYDVALGQLAVSCFTSREWERADSLFRKGLAAPSPSPYSTPVFLSNYARMKLLQPEPDPEAALELFERLRVMQGGLSMQDAGAYAYALILSGKVRDAKPIVEQLKAQASSAEVELNPWLCRCALALGNDREAYHLLSQMKVMEEAEIQRVLTDSVSDAISAYQELAANQKRLQYRVNLAILSVILLALALALVLANFRRNKLEEERAQIQGVCAILEKEVAAQETRTEHLQEQLLHFREVARQERVRRFRQAGRLQSSIWRLDHLGVPSWFKKDPSIAAIKEELSYVYDIDDSGEKLLQRLDNELDGAIIPLLEKLNMRGKAQDQLFLCCCLLDLPSDVVSAKFGITPNNVRVKRHRLRDQIAKLNDADYNALFDIRK